jgi:hypothetical protein
MSNSFAQSTKAQSTAPPTASPQLHEGPMAQAHPYPGWMSPVGGDSSALLPWIDHDHHDAAVPSTADLSPSAGPADLSHASNPVLLGAAEKRLEAIYKNYSVGLQQAVKALREPPPPKHGDFALSVMATLVEGLAGLCFGRLGAAVVDRLKQASVSDATVETAKNVLRNYTTNAGKAAHQAMSATDGSPHDKDYVADKPLLDEFDAQQQTMLNDSQTEAAIKLSTLQDVIARTDRAALAHLDEALLALMGPKSMQGYESQVVTTWMTLCASASLGPQPQDGPGTMPGANRAGGIETAGPDAVLSWHASHEGFLEIAIEVPEQIDGIRGLHLESMTVALEGPGAAQVLRKRAVSVLALPVYRRITLSKKGSKLYASRAMILTPKGELELDGGNVVLAAIGRARPTMFDDRWLLGRDGDRVHDPAISLTAGDVVRANDAQYGASLVASWLAPHTTKELS